MRSTQNSTEQNIKNCSKVYPNPEFETLIANESEQLQLFAREAFYDNPEQFSFIGGSRLHAADVKRICRIVEEFENAAAAKQHASDENFIRPSYPDEQFESDLRAFLQKTLSETPFQDELVDQARSAFYEHYEPRLIRSHVPFEILGRMLDFAMSELQKRGMPLS